LPRLLPSWIGEDPDDGTCGFSSEVHLKTDCDGLSIAFRRRQKRFQTLFQLPKLGQRRSPRDAVDRAITITMPGLTTLRLHRIEYLRYDLPVPPPSTSSERPASLMPVIDESKKIRFWNSRR
jgi:hypothetical protein